MSKTEIKYGRWRSTYYCVACSREMSFGTMMGSGGTCPYCGKISRGTVVDCLKTSKRLVTEYQWVLWFFKRRVRAVWEYAQKENHDA